MLLTRLVQKHFLFLLAIVAIAGWAMVLFRPGPAPSPAVESTPAKVWKLKIATVDMSALKSRFYVFENAMLEREAQMEAIQEEDSSRQDRLKKIKNELEDFIQRITDPSLGFADRDEARKAAKEKEADLQALMKERQAFIEVSSKDLNKKMAALDNEIT